jgi:hypothetical protein
MFAETVHTRTPSTSPAYSPDGNSALVYFWTGRGELAASGYMYLLERASGTWKVVRTFMPWIS